MSATGWQLGAYAGYDAGSFYIRGIGSYEVAARERWSEILKYHRARLRLLSWIL